MGRQCIYPKDVQLLTGRSERYGRELISKIKKANNKEKRHFVTVDELSIYTGIKKELIEAVLN